MICKGEIEIDCGRKFCGECSFQCSTDHTVWVREYCRIFKVDLQTGKYARPKRCQECKDLFK